MKKFLGCIFSIFILVIVFTEHVSAYTVSQITYMPYDTSTKYESEEYLDINDINQKERVLKITEELDMLEETVIKADNLEVYVVNMKVWKLADEDDIKLFFGNYEWETLPTLRLGIKGLFYVKQNSIAIFQSLYGHSHEANTVAHEFGHYVCYNYLTTKELKKYLKMRNYKGHDIEEVFAYDFQYLFGSNHIYNSRYLTTKPDETIKKWILDKIQK